MLMVKKELKMLLTGKEIQDLLETTGLKITFSLTLIVVTVMSNTGDLLIYSCIFYLFIFLYLIFYTNKIIHLPTVLESLVEPI